MEILQWVVTFLKKLWKGLAKSQASRANSPTTASVQQQQLEHWKKEFQISLLRSVPGIEMLGLCKNINARKPQLGLSFQRLSIVASPCHFPIPLVVKRRH